MRSRLTRVRSWVSGIWSSGRDWTRSLGRIRGRLARVKSRLGRIRNRLVRVRGRLVRVRSRLGGMRGRLSKVKNWLGRVRSCVKSRLGRISRVWSSKMGWTRSLCGVRCRLFRISKLRCSGFHFNWWSRVGVGVGGRWFLALCSIGSGLSRVGTRLG